MPLSRYARTPVLNFGQFYGTSNTIATIRASIKDGTLSYKEIVLRGAERLDTIAGAAYGDGRLWWVLAAASNIGWALQCPPGTLIKIPNIGDVARLVG